MRTFQQWLETTNRTNCWQEAGSFAIQEADAVHDRMVANYASRIAQGEKPQDVMSGLTPNGPYADFWNAVMAQVAKLRGQQQTNQQQNQQPARQFSVSTLEQRLGIRSGSLDIRRSQDGRFVFVRNRLTGESLSVQPNPAAIEQAARRLFKLV